ncbi:hypothetical protein QTG54_014310 [Skeletonema marinoi]|uniref:Uncharacterized protein n=1 Tax=Skeletonema marinoi TaxID=267567 RepID=A0AAD9D6N4_9STRA|nr:hypothetical protein QTG54_014310 [Skeletonema marinoi]
MSRHIFSGSGAVTFAFLLATTIRSADAATYTCPPVDTPTVITEATTVTLGSTTAKSELCTLTRRQASSGARRVPVARSYAGRSWEKSAGLFARSGSGLVVDCGGGTECELTLPSLGEDQEYVLESFSYEVTAEAEAARFLEQATFGPTRESINELVATSNNFASWVHTQMYTTPASYHREFLRRNTHPKIEYPYTTAAVGPRPCEQYSRWRKYAITSRDLMDDRYTDRQKHLTIEQVEGVTGFLWLVDGTFRTVTQDQPTFTDGSLVKLDKRYRINEMSRSFMVNCVGCPFLLTWGDDSNTNEGHIANPPVSIEGVEGNAAVLPYATVTLPPFGSNEFPAVEMASEEFPLFTEWMKDDENALLNSDSLESSAQCDGFPSFRQPEAVAETKDDAPLSILPTVFGRSANPVTGLEETFAYDPHLTLYENTPDKPLADGGGQLVIDTYEPLEPGHQIMCHNVHRAHDNEDGCQLSYLDTACAPDTVPRETIVLDGANVEDISALTSRSLLAVTGLTISEDLNAEDGVFVNSVLDEDSVLSIEGCNSWSRAHAAMDRNTEKFVCDREGIQNIPASVVFSPPRSQLSIVHKLRMYTASSSANSDPASFILEGRVKPDAEWEIISSGDLDLPLDRNGRGKPLGSTYESGDTNRHYIEVSLSSNTKAYWDYKLSIPATRDPIRSDLQFAEVELPGLLLPSFPVSHSCTPGAQSSRWMKEADAETCPNSASLGEGTYKLFSDLISAKPYVYNPSIRDVTREYRECDSVDTYKLDLGMVQASDGTCWKHVHDLEHSIFDLTGADPADYTVSGSMAQVSNAFVDGIVNDPAHPIIGNLDDHIAIDSSPKSPLDQQDVQDAFMTLEFNPTRQAVLICGSPGEVATDPFASDHSFDINLPQNTGARTMSIWELSAQRHTTWAQLAMHADDQLRQRQSWALSQIISVGLPGSGTANEVNEPYPSFYDQYVRNGFGSYRNLLKDISFNKIMSEWLSFLDNKSLQYNINKGSIMYADENFAREIMQLFSIGLFMLNKDGSKVLDEDGKPVETYTIDDIMSYATAWTGFEERDARGGASAGDRNVDRSLDPLYINPESRDHFPKSNLYGGFIGDQVALCNDLPDRAFLRKGATYKILGSDPTPTMLSSEVAVEMNPDRPKMELLPSSPLFNRLCSPDSNGDCTFPRRSSSKTIFSTMMQPSSVLNTKLKPFELLR